MFSLAPRLRRGTPLSGLRLLSSPALPVALGLGAPCQGGEPGQSSDGHGRSESMKVSDGSFFHGALDPRAIWWNRGFTGIGFVGHSSVSLHSHCRSAHLDLKYVTKELLKVVVERTLHAVQCNPAMIFLYSLQHVSWGLPLRENRPSMKQSAR